MGQLAELGHMQAIATGPLAPVRRQADPLLAGQGRQGGAALLAAAAGAGVALQHLLQQPKRRRISQWQAQLAGGLLQPA